MKIELNITPLENWLERLAKPLVIAGPCSAETEDQTVSTCRLLAGTGRVSLLRAGIWKPRTRPGEFEGVGTAGLEWLKSAKLETGLPVAVEVATAGHVDLALKMDVDVLWIGARSTANPFTVQEIADSLKGVDVPVMIKNPVNPDLQLWIGALERINKAGVKKIAAIHRGFSSYEKTAFRNQPMWQLPILLKTHCPLLPLICDPSHITGDRSLLLSVAQRALDLDMQGLMIESHLNPDRAWTDSKQQVTPENLARLLGDLVLPVFTGDAHLANLLAEIRSEIDEVDQDLLKKLGERMKLITKIGKYKRDERITILQVERWDQVMHSWKAAGGQLGLTDDFIENFFDLIHYESIRRQSRIIEDA